MYEDATRPAACQPSEDSARPWEMQQVQHHFRCEACDFQFCQYYVQRICGVMHWYLWDFIQPFPKKKGSLLLLAVFLFYQTFFFKNNVVDCFWCTVSSTWFESFQIMLIYLNISIGHRDDILTTGVCVCQGSRLGYNLGHRWEQVFYICLAAGSSDRRVRWFILYLLPCFPRTCCWTIQLNMFWISSNHVNHP